MAAGPHELALTNEPVLEALTHQLRAGGALSADQVTAAVTWLVEEHNPTELKAAFLTSLAQKGETAEEIAAFVRALRGKSIPPPLDATTRARDILDVCGTGGDQLGTFNISTTVSLVVAAAGITVAKHGNRAITSRAGSADVLEALGVPVDLEPAQAAQALRDHGFAFFFAPKYHPAFRHLAAARKLCAERGQRTIFNFLGPLLNPAPLTVQLVGVPRPELCEPMARVLQSLGLRRGLVACGSLESGAPGASPPRSTPRYLDELSTLGATTIAEFYQDRGFNVSPWQAAPGTWQAATVADLAGGDRATNAAIIRRILEGAERGPKRDAVLLNAGAALLVAGTVRSIGEGAEQAAELIDRGLAQAKLTELIRR